MMLRRTTLCLATTLLWATIAEAYQPHHRFSHSHAPSAVVTKPAAPVPAARTAATMALAVLLSTAVLPLAPAGASTTAAQIDLEQIPPTSISVQISDLPVVGSWLSGTYTKVPDGTVTTKPSIIIQSPVDKVKAIQELATAGHLEFDVTGRIQTHLDVDLAADEPGVARVRIASNLIPKLPYKNLASSPTSPTGGRESAWNVVTNLGNGETYYYNAKTGVTQLERPDKI